jgi:hypothetical protein
MAPTTRSAMPPLHRIQQAVANVKVGFELSTLGWTRYSPCCTPAGRHGTGVRHTVSQAAFRLALASSLSIKGSTSDVLGTKHHENHDMLSSGHTLPRERLVL